jgi:hypothetical protein
MEKGRVFGIFRGDEKLFVHNRLISHLISILGQYLLQHFKIHLSLFYDRISFNAPLVNSSSIIFKYISLLLGS